jgi:hypothetical protein
MKQQQEWQAHAAATAAEAPICAALFPGPGAGGGKPTVPPLPLPVLCAFELWLDGVPSPPELLELGSAPPMADDE